MFMSKTKIGFVVINWKLTDAKIDAKTEKGIHCLWKAHENLD